MDYNDSFHVSKKLPAIQNLIYYLEDAGFTIAMRHNLFEKWELPRFHPENFLSVKGYTIIEFIHEDWSIIIPGTSYCSIHDDWDKVKGTKVAFNDAMKNLASVLGRDKVKEIFDPADCTCFG